jgi:hypothetical protein
MSVVTFSFGNGLLNIPLSHFPGRRRRSWVSLVSTGCHNGQVVYVVHRCPVVAGMVQLHLAWQHKVLPA